MRITVPTYRPTAVGSLFTAHSSLAALFAFSAKERDAETGLSYFGARYYSSDLSIWLSVDPMSGKYPSLSPYVYCADNPVKCVDPNGEEVINPYKELMEAARNDVSNAQNRLNSLQKGTSEYETAEGQLNAAKCDFETAKSNYYKVESAIDEVKKFNNALYNSANNLKDENNQTIDVYITIDLTLEDAGNAFINRENGVFCQFDLSNRISTISGVIVSLNPNADPDVGLTLSHELGHVNYTVPNATEYARFLKKNGLDYGGYKGHSEDPLDESGKAAYDAENNHRNNRGY